MDFPEPTSDFDKNEVYRSSFIRELILMQMNSPGIDPDVAILAGRDIPRRLVRYWHDLTDLPEDVQCCLESWDRLANEGFELLMFDDISSAEYIADVYGEREFKAFLKCDHPAMRSDYFRLCFILAEGGFYVDSDDVLLGDEWKNLFIDSRLKLQPLCYDLAAGRMMDAKDIWRDEQGIDCCNFYVNNDPLLAPSGHPVLRTALTQATEKLSTTARIRDIQGTTGPGNLTSALAGHAWLLRSSGLPVDFCFIRGWDSIAEMRWNLSYRNDDRNWRNVYGC